MSDDEKTRRISTRKSSDTNTEIDATVAYPGLKEDPTSPLPTKGRDDAAQTRDEDYTKINRPTKSSSPATVAAGVTQSPADEFNNVEPVVGWLVVIDGPGKGQAIKLGFGMNNIGRSSQARAALDFGDEEISRQDHASVTYDPKGNKFYLQHGGGINLTYVGDSPVLQPVELKGREHILIGNTKLMFVPFCGPEFVW